MKTLHGSGMLCSWRLSALLRMLAVALLMVTGVSSQLQARNDCCANLTTGQDCTPSAKMTCLPGCQACAALSPCGTEGRGLARMTDGPAQVVVLTLSHQINGLPATPPPERRVFMLT
jgi:hypothetical protein